MKKFSNLSKLSVAGILFMLLAGNVSAKFNPSNFYIPFYEAPKEQKYSNYKTYSMYAFFPKAPGGYSIEGYYSVISENMLHEDRDNADFKMLLEIESVVNGILSVERNMAYIKAQSVSVVLMVFDKDGNSVVRQSYNIQTPSASIAGDYAKITQEEKEELRTPLRQALVKELATMCAKKFTDEFLLQVRRSNSFYVAYLGNIFNFKTTPKEKEISDEVQKMIDAGNPGDLLQTAKEQLNYWVELAELPDDKDKADYEDYPDYRTVGIYNCAFIYLLLGDTAKSDEYFARLNSTAVKYFNLTRKAFPPLDKLKKPVFEGPFAHDENLKSSFSTKDLVDRILYYVIKNATVVLKNGVEYNKCVCKVSYTKHIDEFFGAGVIDLDGDDFDVVIEKEDGTQETTLLSKIQTVTSSDKILELGKRKLYVAEVYGKVSVYKRIVPIGNFEYYTYKMPNGEFETTPIFGKSKWYKKHFGDCPALLEKIDKDEVKTPVEIANFYNECK